jgi:hypothetical protein
MTHYRGVSITHGHYQAQVRVQGRLVYLGLFRSPGLAAAAYDLAATEYHGTKAKLNFTDRQITIRQEQIYRLCSPDHHNLTYKNAGKLLGISDSTICRELKKIKKKCPGLFPLYVPRRGRQSVHYRPWQDFMIAEKF